MKVSQTSIVVRMREPKQAYVSVTVEGQNAGVFEGTAADAWAFVAALALQSQHGFERLAAGKTSDEIMGGAEKGGGA